jgi:demethylmenaquinone methyltransferase/2-methoxy-6-polyprenyl-1,4-benzoquinol methylase
MSDDQSSYLRQLLVTAELREPALRSAIAALELPTGSSGLDVGCGAGLQCVLLAEAVGPNGHVTGVDVSEEFLDHGRDLLDRAGLSQRVSLREGSAADLPFEDDAFDWAWSVDCVGYGAWEPLPLLREMARVVRPGGTVASLGWSSEQLLPGHPELEARLKGTAIGLAPFRRELGPERHFPRTLGWLRALGLTDLRALTFAGGAHAPLSTNDRLALEALLDMRWPGAEDELSADDLAEFERLLCRESPDFVLDHPDYYAFFTYSMFSGRVPD